MDLGMWWDLGVHPVDMNSRKYFRQKKEHILTFRILNKAFVQCSQKLQSATITQFLKEKRFWKLLWREVGKRGKC